VLAGLTIGNASDLSRCKIKAPSDRKLSPDEFIRCHIRVFIVDAALPCPFRHSCIECPAVADVEHDEDVCGRNVIHDLGETGEIQIRRMFGVVLLQSGFRADEKPFLLSLIEKSVTGEIDEELIVLSITVCGVFVQYVNDLFGPRIGDYPRFRVRETIVAAQFVGYRVGVVQRIILAGVRQLSITFAALRVRQTRSELCAGVSFLRRIARRAVGGSKSRRLAKQKGRVKSTSMRGALCIVGMVSLHGLRFV
jgi:hypothetical protein